MPKSELDPKECIAKINEHLEEIIFNVIDKVISYRKSHPFILEEVISEAHAALHAWKFNGHRPQNTLAWYIISFPIRVVFDYERERILLIAKVMERLSIQSLDEYILEVETRTMKKMVA